MNVDGKPFRTIWLADDGETVEIIDQTRLPHAFEIIRLATCEDAARAITSMQVRGAPLIGATAAYGLCLALRDDASDGALAGAYDALLATRPTAVNLRWALDEMQGLLGPCRCGTAPPPPMGAPRRSVTKMSPSAAPSAITAWRLSAIFGKNPGNPVRSIF